jgi:hypothetical protein
MNYQLRGLEPRLFESLFDLDEASLAARGMRRMRVDAPVGFPCRISLEDAPVGEDVLLLPFTHQTADRLTGPPGRSSCGVASARRRVSWGLCRRT